MIGLYFCGSPKYIWNFLNYCFQDTKDEGGKYLNHELSNRKKCKTIWSWFESIKQRSHCFSEYDGTKQDIFPSNHHNKIKHVCFATRL